MTEIIRNGLTASFRRRYPELFEDLAALQPPRPLKKRVPKPEKILPEDMHKYYEVDSTFHAVAQEVARSAAAHISRRTKGKYTLRFVTEIQNGIAVRGVRIWRIK
jgi:hypothetical protein